MLFLRVVTLVVTVLYYPAYTIRSMAYGQLAVSTTLLVLYWVYFHLEFQKKAKLQKNKKQHRNDPLLSLPFNSVADFLPRRIEGQVMLQKNVIGYVVPARNPPFLVMKHYWQALIGFDLAFLTWGFFKQVQYLNVREMLGNILHNLRANMKLTFLPGNIETTVDWRRAICYDCFRRFELCGTRSLRRG